MSTVEKRWLKNYPQGVPHEIDFGGYTSLVDLVNDNLKKYANRPAFRSFVGSSEKALSFAEVDQLSKQFAAYLQNDMGLKPGDRLALMMPNLLQYPIALFAAMRAGLTIVNTNPLYTAREIEHQFNDAGVTAVIIAENFAAELEKVIDKTQVKRNKVIVVSIGEMFGGFKGWLINFAVRNLKKMVPSYNLAGHIKFKKALNKGNASQLKMATGGQLDDVICLQYTGGTTGVAKGAELTNKNLLANAFQVEGWIKSANIKEGQERILTPLPLYHIFSFTVNLLCLGTSFGTCNVLVVNPRDLPSVVDIMKKTQPSIMTGVNTLFNALLNHAEFAQLDFSKLQIVIGGAMAIQKPVAEKWKKITGSTLTEGYGMTEASPVVSVNPLYDEGRIGTIGLPIPSTEIRICDEENNPLPLGEAGEIQVRGPQVMKGYLNRPEATAKTIIDGWLRTGDVGIMDEDGFVKIVDRIKDIILVSGFNVYPNEIEEVLAAHPKVLEVAAVGVPDPKSTEAVKVFVVKKDPSLTEEELRAFSKENFTGYKKPKHYEFREELPKTNVGKILRRALRDEAKQA